MECWGTWVIEMTAGAGVSADSVDAGRGHRMQCSQVLLEEEKETTRQGSRLRVKCQWANCSVEPFLNTPDLRDHLLNEHCQASDEGVCVCGVSGCSFSTVDGPSFVRHLLFHCYHADRQLNAVRTLAVKQRRPLRPRCLGSIDRPNEVLYLGKLIQCLWDTCREAFDDPCDYDLHVEKHVMWAPIWDNTLACQWEYCGRAFEKRSQLRSHVQHHSGVKPCACPFCGVFLSSMQVLRDHIDRVGSNAADNSRFKCFHCFKTFATERLLKGHARRHVKTYQCNVCQLTLDSPSDLRSHLADRHIAERKFACDKCSKAFKRQRDCDRHRFNAHAPQPVFSCELCGREFRWSNALVQHKIIHHSLSKRSYECHVCVNKKTYTTGFRLGLHLRKAHQLQLPQGHSRFFFKECDDGQYRLETVRFESSRLAGLDDNSMREAPDEHLLISK